MIDTRPGLNPQRLTRLITMAIERCQLDLSGRVVLTEAASGAYVVTPVLAALAKADHVYAVTRNTRYGSAADISAATYDLAARSGAQQRIEVITQIPQKIVSQADIITNSGHVRPIDATMISRMKSTAVISLMYEAWEFRPEDVDLSACRQRGIAVGGVNERHPAVDVFSFLGTMAIKLVTDAGVAVYASRILLLCDNAFSPFIANGLSNAGAHVETHTTLSAVGLENSSYDVVLVALQPRSGPVLDATDALTIAQRWPGAVLAQFWGDLDRSMLAAAGVPVWPLEAPALGHMGILPSELGPEPIVRLQAGGLKAAELLSRTTPHPERYWHELVQTLCETGQL